MRLVVILVLLEKRLEEARDRVGAKTPLEPLRSAIPAENDRGE